MSLNAQLMLPHSPPQLRKAFSLDKAQRALPFVRRVVEDVVAEYSSMLETQEMLEKLQCHGSIAKIRSLQQRLGQCSQRLQAYARELDESGVELRDYAHGVVDFPCTHQGRRIYLTWQLGQESIQDWYNPTGQARMPVIALRQKS